MGNEDLLKKIRDKIRTQQNDKRDPTQYRVPNLKAGGPDHKAKFVVLPGLLKGDKCTTGVASETMDEMAFTDGTKVAAFCIRGGQHWINNHPYGCPRMFDNEDCPICQLGFDLLGECDIPEERKNIIKNYLPRNVFAVNVYFPPLSSNPEDVKGKVFWYSLPKGVFDKMEGCLLREDDGGDSDDPQPYGMFYDPNDCLIFQLNVRHKDGYNNYDESKFLIKRGAIADSDEKIAEILSRRHDIVAKFPKRNVKELNDLLTKIHKGSDIEAPAKEPTKEPKKNAPPAEEKPKAKAVVSDDELPASKPKVKTEAKSAPAPAPSKPRPSAAADIDDPELQSLINQARDE